MAAGPGEGQVGRQPGRPLRVSASHVRLVREAPWSSVATPNKAFHCRFVCLSESAALRALFPLNREHVGESILYLWVEKIREFLVERSQSPDTGEAADETLDGMTLLS